MLKIGKVYNLEGSPFRYVGTDGTWELLKEVPDGYVRKYLVGTVDNLPLWSEPKDAI